MSSLLIGTVPDKPADGTVASPANLPLAIEEELHVELGVSSLTHPLVTEHRDVLPSHREDGLKSHIIVLATPFFS